MLKKNNSKYSLALMFSLALHILSFGFIYKKINQNHSFDQFVTQVKSIPSQVIKLDSIKFINQKELQNIKDSNRKQIVANENIGKNERPVKSKFAGEVNQQFERQTIAAHNGIFKKAGLGIKNGIQNSIAQNKEATAEVKKSHRVEKIQKISSKLNLSELGAINISKVEDEEKIQREAKKSAAEGLTNGNSGTTGLARNNDYVEDIPLGDMTNLNTTEFKYYGFYHRIRQKLEQYWGSSIQNKAKHLYKSGRRLPASENLITAITVTLDDRGNILEIQINGTSGIRELDQAAIESFNKAGPFPNPPKGLLVGGRAVIQWGFVVKS